MTSVSRWWLDRPLRTRLVLAAGLATVIAVVGVVGVAYVVVRHELRSQLDSQLRRRAEDVTRDLRVRPGPGGDGVVAPGQRFGEPGSYVQLITDDGQTARPNGQTVVLPVSTRERGVAKAGATKGVLRDARIDRTRVRMFTSPTRVPGLAVQVALPLTTVNAQLDRLVLPFSGLTAAALAIALLLAWAVSRTALAPVARLTETTEQVALTRDLRYRLPAESRTDELGRLAVSFNAMLAALEQSVTAQRQLVADASHELRTPLASLRTNAEVLRRIDELSPADRESLLTGVVGQVDELTALVADVVELARGDDPRVHVDDVALDQVVGHALERARRNWRGIEFVDEVAPVTVIGDAGRIERAVANLLDNAAKFSSGSGRVEVRLTSDGRFTVRDHGPGIPAEALGHVFDRFYRSDEARALPGSGLGLAIVKQVADSHGGSVTLGNAPDGGAVAALWLPVAARDPGPPVTSP